MIKYLLVSNSSCLINHVFLNIGTIFANFNALEKVHVAIHLFINDCSGVSRILFRGGGSKFFWKNGDICMALCAMQRVAKPRVC